MKGARIPLRSHVTSSGTLFARVRAVTLASAVLMASSSGYSGCLLGTRLVDDDADLRPLQPPVIIDSSPALPGSIIVVNNPSPNSVRVNFDVTIVTDSRSDLLAQWFVDRTRPNCDPLSTCGLRILQPVPGPDPSSTSRRRTFTQQIDVSQHHCTVVDLYVSSAFKQTSAQEHEPVREGDVAFARWFVVRVDPARQTTEPLSFIDCVREN